MIDNEQINTWYGTMSFDYNHCFLCGSQLSDDKKTVEHIFPKWLLKKHNLWNQTLSLPNKSLIKYRQLVIPCCTACNNEYLSGIENKVKSAFANGIGEVRGLEPTVLYQWFSKIFYGLMFKNLSLKASQHVNNDEKILNSDFLINHRFLFDCMQSIRLPICLDKNHSSLFIFEVHKDLYSKTVGDFFYFDDLNYSTIILQSENIGIVCCIGEHKAIEHKLEKYLDPFFSIILHPFQFRQLMADIYYNRRLLRTGTSGLFTDNEIITLTPLSDLYDEYSQFEYAKCLYFFLKNNNPCFEFESLYSKEHDAVQNFLLDSERRLIIYKSYSEYYFGQQHLGYSGKPLFDHKIRVDYP